MTSCLGVSRVVLSRRIVRSEPQSRGVRSRAASPCTMSVLFCARRQSRRAEWPRREESRVVASCVIASRVVSSNCIDAAFHTIIECFSFFQVPAESCRTECSFFLVLY